MIGLHAILQNGKLLSGDRVAHFRGQWAELAFARRDEHFIEERFVAGPCCAKPEGRAFDQRFPHGPDRQDVRLAVRRTVRGTKSKCTNMSCPSRWKNSNHSLGVFSTSRPPTFRSNSS